MTEALRLGPDDRVLEIGTGSGYAAAVLARIAREVYTIERHKELADTATCRLARLGFDNVFVRHGDGTLGWAEHAPSLPPAFFPVLAALVGAYLVAVEAVKRWFYRRVTTPFVAGAAPERHGGKA